MHHLGLPNRTRLAIEVLDQELAVVLHDPVPQISRVTLPSRTCPISSTGHRMPISLRRTSLPMRLPASNFPDLAQLVSSARMEPDGDEDTR